jgi:hypothetical protein
VEKLMKKTFSAILKELNTELNELETLEDMTVAKIMEKMNFDVLQKINEPFETIIKNIFADGAEEGSGQIGVSVSTDLMNEQALLFAQERGAELVGMRNIGTKESPQWVPNENAKWAISDSTREFIRADIEQAINEGWSTGTLKDKLGENYAFSDRRAETIARTEIAKADMEGNMAAYRASGVVMGKEWLLGSEYDEDDICQDNADAGVIALDAVFPSGDDAPPAHPNCKCTVVPVLMETEGE